MAGYTCDTCSFTFPSKGKLSDHNGTYHSVFLTCNGVTFERDPDTQEFECISRGCNFRTKNRTNMQNHLRRMHRNPQVPLTPHHYDIDGDTDMDHGVDALSEAPAEQEHTFSLSLVAPHGDQPMSPLLDPNNKTSVVASGSGEHPRPLSEYLPSRQRPIH